LPGVVGRGSHHNFLSGALAKILAGEPLEANNPEALFNNIIFIEDLATFIGDWVKRASPGYEVTNIAACDPISIRDVIGLLYTETRHSPQVVFNTSKNNPFLIALDRVNFLGYRPKTVRSSLKSFVQDVINTDNGTS
jgi:nucleoside-diphosphate-sugar epimerase